MAKRRKRKLPWVIALLLIGTALAFYFGNHLAYGPALKLPKEAVSFYIHSDWDEQKVFEELQRRSWVRHPKFLRWVMSRKNYSGALVVAGKYTLDAAMSANGLINHLRAGNGEEEVDITFNLARSLQDLASKASKNIEADSAAIADKLLDQATAEKFGFTSANFLSMFLPDTYRSEWDLDADEFIARMAQEYKQFWSSDRVTRASDLGLTQSQVSTLASVVQAEQQIHPEERPIIAGLYLNRLRRGMRLQSDPTVIYAVGDFSINRVLTAHLSTVSPYNTYLNAGLPPGPINLPSKRSIDAVLYADSNDYLYMCAKADFSGYHAFAKGLAQHNRNANAFRKALNDRKIYH